MKYKGRWIPDYPTDGNVAKAAESIQDVPEEPKVLHVDCFAPRRGNDRTEHKRRVRRRRRRALTYRLALQCLTMTLLLIMIAMLDGASLVQTMVIMLGILSCSAVMLLLDLDERKER